MPTGRRAQWMLKLEEYDYNVKFRKGKKIPHVDFLSRNPIQKVTWNDELEWIPSIYEYVPKEVLEEEAVTLIYEPDPNDSYLVNQRWWEVPEEVWEEDKTLYTITEAKFVLAVLYLKEGVYLLIRLDPEKPFYLKSQVPCRASEQGETAVQAAHREVYEETGLSIPHKRFKSLDKDPEFDC